MKKAGTQCSAFGCNKRKRVKEDKERPRGDSEGSDDEESAVKRKFPQCLQLFNCKYSSYDHILRYKYIITPVAADALVLMAVSLNDSWKVPCAYFLVNGLSGEERANLIEECIRRLYDAGVTVVSLTCDGPSCHFSMLKHLGVILDPATLKAFFVHPLDPQNKIYVFLDICHMLKLIRNSLGTGGVFIDQDGNKILWQYFVELQKLQDEEGLRLGNKLKLVHIKWQQQKMKVNLAAQTFSTSVADAIEYCCQTLKLEQFQGSEATVKFVRIFDRLFDILNSRNPCAKGNKSALRIGNKDIWSPFLDEAFKYILALKDQPMFQCTPPDERLDLLASYLQSKASKEFLVR